MDTERKKQLLREYKDRKPEMGVISFRCKQTQESFLGISTDTKADLNSVKVKLASNFHPNKRLLELWNQYGETGFELSVLKCLKYKEPGADYTEELEKLREQCLSSDPKAKRIWK